MEQQLTRLREEWRSRAPYSNERRSRKRISSQRSLREWSLGDGGLQNRRKKRTGRSGERLPVETHWTGTFWPGYLAGRVEVMSAFGVFWSVLYEGFGERVPCRRMDSVDEDCTRGSVLFFSASVCQWICAKDKPGSAEYDNTAPKCWFRMMV